MDGVCFGIRMPELNEPRVEVRRQAELSDTEQTTGMDRQMAFQTEDTTMIRLQVESGEISDWHHHGDHHIFGYLEKGRGKWEYGESDDDTVIVEEGDFWHIPPRTIHRDINPTDEVQTAIVAIVGSGPLAIDVDGPSADPSVE